MGMLVMPAWRGTLVVPAESEWIIKRNAADPTSGSLRDEGSDGHACHARLEGHACHARRSGIDYPMWCGGPDKRVPPRGKSEGRACHARHVERTTLATR